MSVYFFFLFSFLPLFINSWLSYYYAGAGLQTAI